MRKLNKILVICLIIISLFTFSFAVYGADNTEQPVKVSLIEKFTNTISNIWNGFISLFSVDNNNTDEKQDKITAYILKGEADKDIYLSKEMLDKMLPNYEKLDEETKNLIEIIEDTTQNLKDKENNGEIICILTEEDFKKFEEDMQQRSIESQGEYQKTVDEEQRKFEETQKQIEGLINE